MNAWRRIFGTDPVETLLWGAGAFLLTIWTLDYYHDHNFGTAAALVSVVAYGVRRAAALKALGAGETTSGAYRAADLDARVAELERLHQRVAELEERVDFSERLLARQNEPAGLERPL